MKAITSKRPFIFLGVGLINTLLDFTFYTFLTLVVFNDNNIAIVGIISGTFALICAFITHSLVTWRDKHVDYRVFIRFIIFTGFGLWVIRPILLTLFVKLSALYNFVYSILNTSLHLPLSLAFIKNTGAFCFMIIIVLVYNYVVYGRFVFRNDKSTDKNTAGNTD
jgi:putative flippase GtrA